MVHLYSALITYVSKALYNDQLYNLQFTPSGQAQIAAASKQSMHAGTHFTDLGRMES